MEKFVAIKGIGRKNGGFDVWFGNWDFENVAGLWCELAYVDGECVNFALENEWLSCGDLAKNIKEFLDEALEKGFIDSYKLEEPKEKLALEEQTRDFLKDSILKHVASYENKDGLIDLLKAQEYLSRLIMLEETKRKAETFKDASIELDSLK